MPLLDALNPQQRIAAQAVEGPVLIFAGAGSGKTRVLTYRIAHMVQDCGIAPDQILAVTFTNKAANELKERIASVVGPAARRIWAGTFHSICARILRADGEAIGIDPAFTIYDESDQRSLVKQALGVLDVDSKQYTPVSVHSAISRAKNEMLDVQAFRRTAKPGFEEVVSRAYGVYQRLLRESKALDFDDLLMRAVELLERHPEALEKYQRRLRYILVDEYQDVNQAQFRLVQLLGQAHGNVCVVGDDDQSIYGWRGANVGIILAFERHWPKAKVIKLEQNYRSTQKILRCAYDVIKHNEDRAEKQLWTDNPPGENTVCYAAVNEDEEAEWVANLVNSQVSRGEACFGDFAVLYRANAMSRAFESAMMNARIPYRIVGGLRYYERAEIKDVVAYLRVLHNPADGVSLRRIVNVPARGIGDKTLALADRIADRSSISLYDALPLAAEDEELRPAQRRALLEFHELMEDLRRQQERQRLTELTRSVIERSGLLRKLKESSSAEDSGRAENVEEFVTSARRFEETSDDRSLAAFLEHIALISDLDQAGEAGNAVSLMTLHSAKGLEFPIVIIVGLEEGIFPHQRSMGDEFELAEERRLCYVGITRAQRKLYLSHASRRTIYGETQVMQPSRFLGDLPRECVDWGGDMGTRRGARLVDLEQQEGPGERIIGGRKIDLTQVLSRARANATTSRERQAAERRRAPLAAEGARDSAEDRPSDAPTPPRRRCAPPPQESVPTFSTGQRVRHAKFGQGVIVSTKGDGADAELTVAFRGAGVKKLIARYAKLEAL